MRYISSTICTLFAESAAWFPCMMLSGKAAFFHCTWLWFVDLCSTELYHPWPRANESCVLEHRCAYPLPLFLCLSFLFSFSNSVAFAKFNPLLSLFSSLFWCIFVVMMSSFISPCPGLNVAPGGCVHTHT